jgi:hypothetical protein
MFSPRPFRAINGEHDPIFPAAGAREQFETVKAAYALWDAADKASLVFHPGGHAYHHGHSQAWFGEYL